MVGLNPGTAYHFRSKWQRNLEREGGTFDYSYGDSFKSQLPKVVRALKKEYDREAIISVWDKGFLDRGSYARRPCTLTIQFYNRKGYLHCFVNMRSNDVINLLPYDVFHHTSLQTFIASITGLRLGNYYHTCAQYYWPKKRELRGFGEKMLEKLQATTPPQNTHFPWVEPRLSLVNASKTIRSYISHHNFEDIGIPDPYIQGLVNYITTRVTANATSET
jgi:hypothetical protein